jgi:hypothetical protein
MAHVWGITSLLASGNVRVIECANGSKRSDNTIPLWLDNFENEKLHPARASRRAPGAAGQALKHTQKQTFFHHLNKEAP